MLRQITLIGVGLIGGSLVLDLKRHKQVQTIYGIDLDSENLNRALERHVIDRAFGEICAEAISSADWVVIATPVATLPQICAQLAKWLPEHAIVSDVGSTKVSAIEAFRQHLPRHFARCVASHPIAGSDRSGALAAQFALYQNKKLILCPHERQNSACLNTVAQLWQSVGAHTHIMPADEHDEIFAAVSHLPHLLAFAYVHQMLDHPKGAHYLDFAGSGFRDFTRIAASNPEMWADIMLANQSSLLDLIAAQQNQLAYLSGCLKSGDKAALRDYFQAAKQVREDWGDKQ